MSDPCSPEPITHYDREMAQMVILALKYLRTTRGQSAINRLSATDSELQQVVGTQQHFIPWHNLTLPGWTP